MPARGCKSWWCRRLHGPAAPGPCECRCRSAADALPSKPQRVRCLGFGHACKLNGSLQVLREGFVVAVMTLHDIAVRICPMMTLRTHSEPAPTGTRARVLSLQRIGHLNACLPVFDILARHLPTRRQLRPQTRHQRCGQHHHAVLVALPLPHVIGTLGEIDVLALPPQLLGNPQPRAIQPPCAQLMLARHLGSVAISACW